MKARNTLLIIVGGILLLVLYLSWSPVNASESIETRIEGYEGSKRIITVEKPVKGQPDTTRVQGWAGDKRVNLKVVRTNEYTHTTGWKGNTRINVKERKDD